MKVKKLIEVLSLLDKYAEIEFYECDNISEFHSLSITHESLLHNSGYSKQKQLVRLTIISR